jgi:hypothetical protein
MRRALSFRKSGKPGWRKFRRAMRKAISRVISLISGRQQRVDADI